MKKENFWTKIIKTKMTIKIVGVQMIINWSRLLIAGSSRCIPNLFSISSFCNSSKPVRIVAQSFSISTPHERQVFIFFKLSEGKEIAKNSRWVSKQIGRRGFFNKREGDILSDLFQEILRREIKKRPKWAEIAGMGNEKAKSDSKRVCGSISISLFSLIDQRAKKRQKKSKV